MKLNVDTIEKQLLDAAGYRNSSGVAVLNPWCEGPARRDPIGVAMFNGGTRGVFGTLPLAYAVPTMDNPIMLDMAVSEIPLFQNDRTRSLKTGGTARDWSVWRTAGCRRFRGGEDPASPGSRAAGLPDRPIP